MRSVWTGSIRLGLANIPVKAYGATEEQGGTGLNQVHLADGGRIRHRRVCEVDGTDVALADVAKGYVMPGGEVVVLTDDDFAKLPLPTSRAIEIQSFAPIDDIDPIYFARSYHLEPEPTGAKSYVLFSEALQQSGKVAVVKVALRQRENLGVLRIRDQVIVLETMLWPDEVRQPDFAFLHQDVDIAERELREAATLIDELSEPFTPGRYTDRYREALAELVQAKIDGNELVQPAAAAQREGAADLLGALRTSVAARQVENARAAEAKAAEAKATARKAASRTRTKTRT
jgi:DNA end-binding protein Ku